ncbi:SusD/RagB family nutrient-binding outer membrane lipoprotein [Sinomicrobium weinanense]|uniref:SusD/RagB family nutrient-binding outer membrane lipoprotein n=1 Tax=Sinomicrobium weinanense TaxID=2842200 RepID=A0A926JT53_9FLAO|nr:SusD/RagB family nutrient-binding outer membrane lipoprotein [Sinomicrobium weinanense]MBC9796844.1 SusD/RagB family nutrient-binding outer membrane lipoprotein [Sinomicrobium weinanense]MBU3125217.1 SusD/RagB family nutrient-binding outer membrane lipoprotein [Sinomicrobium weinanense]
MKNILKKSLISLLLIATGCAKDDFAEQNTDPSTVVDPDLRFSITKSIEQMYNDDYTLWFYNNFRYTFPWSQLTTIDLANEEQFVNMGPAGGHNIYASLFPNIRDIRTRIDSMEQEDRSVRRAMRAMTFPILIQPAITQTDNLGARVYSEAALAGYTDPPLLTPVYDNQETLFNTWLEELDAAIPELMTSNQYDMGDQDMIYGGNYGKWAKFCNLLKLKIAVRLINKDRPRALKIAEEVANSPAGYMDNLEDDFIYTRGVLYYGTGNGTQPGTAGKNIVDFMVANKDPRLRFLFTKNEFNAEVVQAFIDAGKDLPPYIDQYVNRDASGNFSNWKAPGEPWVRYFGVPLSPNAQYDSEYDPYFKQSELNRIKIGDVEKSYTSTSNYSERITRTQFNHTYPTKPGGRVIEQKDSYPGLNVILGSSAETNLYLAEFQLLGANLPRSAQEYFDRGVELSVRRLDALSKNNGMPYYENDPVYIDLNEAEAASTRLKLSEIVNLLEQPAYDLSTDGLEKVYIQQYINFAGTPGDLWTLVRRSGIPKTESAYLPWDPFLASGTELSVPRRFVFGTPTEDSKNYENQVKAAEEQGFTTGTNNPSTLNSERIWFDKENPEYGAGPKP